MDVRTFEAFTMKDAVKSVKKTLGSDAVILSTKEKPAPNGRGVIFEVTAASSQHQTRSGGSKVASTSDIDPQFSKKVGELLSRFKGLEETMPSKRQVQTLEAQIDDLKLLILENLRTKEGSVIKDLPQTLVSIDRQLRTMGISDVYIAELMKHLRSLPPKPNSEEYSEIELRDHGIRWMMKKLKIAGRWPIMPGSISYQAFVGGTGAGKSTLVAKLASHYAIKEKHKVAIVTLDNQRLAASEQMRIVAKIIGVPFLAASSAQEIVELATTLQEIELVLIDTPGLSPKNRDGIKQLAEMKESGLPVDFHLCLSATTRESQLEGEVKSFAQLGIASVAFTKLDESWQYGEIFNISTKWSLPLSFFGIGQTIPEDIERATRERVIERVFGL